MNLRGNILLPLVAALCAASAFRCAGTEVRIATALGAIDIALYDKDKPITVANFLRYIKSGGYEGTFLHRLIPGFVVQGGGYALSSGTPTHIATFPPIKNEYAAGKTYSNTFGTIAMAKVPATDDSDNPIAGGGPDSATSEWFINLGDNAADFDNQNGGLVVFGRLVAGFDVLARLNTTFNDADTAIDAILDYSLIGLSVLPALKSSGGTAQTDDLLYATFTILSGPVIVVKSGKAITTGKSALTIGGSVSNSVTHVEWRVGRSGKFHKKSATDFWKVRVSGLKKGKNFVYLRGVAASGEKSALEKVKIIRQ